MLILTSKTFVTLKLYNFHETEDNPPETGNRQAGSLYS